MNNTAEDLSSGLSNMGGSLKVPRTGFRGKKKETKDSSGTKGKGEGTERPEKQSQKTDSSAKKEANKGKTNNSEKPSKDEKLIYDRITFEITADQRATLTSIASDLHYRSDKDKRQGKINRDMIMRSVLAETVKLISWEKGVGELHTESDIRKFIHAQLKAKT